MKTERGCEVSAMEKVERPIGERKEAEETLLGMLLKWSIPEVVLG